MDTSATVQQVAQVVSFVSFALAAVQMLVFMMFGTAVTEVMKQFVAIFRKMPLRPQTIRTLNFITALLFCWSFEYGAMSRLVGVDTTHLGEFAWWMDYIATASVIYMGADYLFSWYWKIKAKADEIAGKKPQSAQPAG